MTAHLRIALALLVSLWAFACPARADYVVKDGNGVLQTIKSGTVGPGILPEQTLVDASGNAVATSGNPFFVSPGAGASWNVVCTSGCSGGSGGTSSNFGSAFPTPGTAIGVSNGTNMVALTLGQQLAASSLPIVLTAAQLTTLTPPAAITNFANETGGNLASIASSTGRIPTQGQALAAASLPVVLTAAQITTLTPPAAITNFSNETGGNLAQIVTDFGAPGATACTTDTASCNQNQQLQRLAQRLTTINTTLGTPFQAGGSIGNTTFASTQSGTWNITNISGTISLPTLAATSTKQSDGSQKSQIVDGAGNVIGSTSNNLNVQCANCSGSGVSAADAASFTAGTSLFAPVGGQFTSGGATSCVTGHECTAGMTADRALFINLADIAGTATATGNGVSGAGVQRVNIASDNTAFAVNATLQASATTAIGKVDPNTVATWGLGVTGSAVPANAQYFGANVGGNLTGLIAKAANTVASTDIALEVAVANANSNGRAVSGSSSPVVPTPALTTWHLIAANSTNATSVKGSAATLFSCQFGTLAGPAWLKIYNKATAPTVGTDTPVKTLIIPVAGTAANGAGSNITFGPGGLTLGTGFAAAVTGGVTDADTTAVAAASTAINCDYE